MADFCISDLLRVLLTSLRLVKLAECCWNDSSGVNLVTDTFTLSIQRITETAEFSNILLILIQALHLQFLSLFLTSLCGSSLFVGIYLRCISLRFIAPHPFFLPFSPSSRFTSSLVLFFAVSVLAPLHSPLVQPEPVTVETGS